MKKLILVDPTGEHINEVLGISEERRIELNEVTGDAIKKYFLEEEYGLTQGAFDISQGCNDEQEYTLSLITFIKGIEHLESKMSAENPLLSLLRAMGK